MANSNRSGGSHKQWETFFGLAVETVDHHKVLGVKRGASKAVIATAYRKLAKQYHPDANPDNDDAVERFKEITAAFEALHGTGVAERPSKRTTKSNTVRKNFVPPKPYPEYPLTPHPGGKWMKKIKGKIHYFGRWGHILNGVMVRLPDDGVDEALAQYEAEVQGIHHPQLAQAQRDQLEVRHMCESFRLHKQALLESGEITPRTYDEYLATAMRLYKFFGRTRVVDSITPEDFVRLRSSIAKQWGPHRLGNEVVRIRSVFKHAKKSDVVPETFKKPSHKVMRVHREERGDRYFEKAELHKLLNNAGVQLKAMILLALNTGYGNGDMGKLPIKAVDLEGGWVKFARPKTGVARRCPLWPETVAALRASLAERETPRSKEDRHLFFITPDGHRCVRLSTTTSKNEDGDKVAKHIPVDAVGTTFGKLLKKLKLNDRQGRSFYSLRHTFRTIADGAMDQVAANSIMGHVDDSMPGTYRHHIDDARLQAVVQHVHTWLFGTEGGAI